MALLPSIPLVVFVYGAAKALDVNSEYIAAPGNKVNVENLCVSLCIGMAEYYACPNILFNRLSPSSHQSHGHVYRLGC